MFIYLLSSTPIPSKLLNILSILSLPFQTNLSHALGVGCKLWVYRAVGVIFNSPTPKGKAVVIRTSSSHPVEEDPLG